MSLEAPLGKTVRDAAKGMLKRISELTARIAQLEAALVAMQDEKLNLIVRAEAAEAERDEAYKAMRLWEARYTELRHRVAEL